MPQITTQEGSTPKDDTLGSSNDPALLLVMGFGAQLIAWPRAFCGQATAQAGPRRCDQSWAVAAARKLVVIVWHMLTKGEDYAFARPSRTREKKPRLELMNGVARQRGRRHAERVFAPRSQHEAERELAAHAEAAYLLLMSDWRSGPTRVGAGLTRGRVKTPTKPRGSAADL
jgi:hypothetical protein